MQSRVHSRFAYVGLAVGIALLLSLGLLNLELLNLGLGAVNSQALAHNIPSLQLDQSEASSPSSTLAITGTLLLTKTVGTDPTDCSAVDELFVTSGTDVYFCYRVQNQTGNTLNFHTLADGSLPQPSFRQDYILAPGQITTTIQGPIKITQEIDRLDGEAEWIATGELETITATSSAEVFLTELGITASLFIGPKAVTTNIDECGSVDQLVIPSGMDVQYCLVIENQGNRPLTAVTIDSPGLGLDNVTLPNRQIAPNGRYQITFGEMNRIRSTIGNIANKFAQFDITSSQTITVSVTGQTQENLATTDTSSAVATVGNQVIGVTLDVRAGNRANACDDTAKSVSSGADVYYCVVVTNSGTLNIVNARISHTESSFGAVDLATLAAGRSYTQTQNALRIAVVHTDTVSFRGDVSTALGRVVITKTAARGVQLIPVSNESLVPIPTLSPTSPTAGPTATNTRRPSLSTSTPFPSDTPTNTFTPSPHPLSPTNTPVSPLPTPIPTPTPVILRAVASPVPVPTAIPTQTPTPTSSPTPTFTPTPPATSTPVPTSTQTAMLTPADTPQTTGESTGEATGGPTEEATENSDENSPTARNSPGAPAEQTAAAQNRQVASNAAQTTADQPASDQAGANQSTSPLPLPTTTAVLADSAPEQNGEADGETNGETNGEAGISQTVSATVTSGSAQVPLPTGTLTATVALSTTSSATDANLPATTGPATTDPATTGPVTTTISNDTANNDAGGNDAGGGSDTGSLVSTDSSPNSPPNSPPSAIETSSSSPAFLMVTSVLEGALAAAAWLWFVCGSIIFFGVGGLIAGLYFRGQENSRFTLIRNRFGGQGSAQETANLASAASKADTDASTSQFQLKGKPQAPSRAGNRSSDKATQRGKAGDDDHWPTSLP